MVLRKKRYGSPTIFHVTSRGMRLSPIFHQEKDYLKFITILDNTYNYSPYNLYAYCLMKNHYHLLIGLKEIPLLKIMHSINGAYASFFNKTYNLQEQPFQNRYTAHPVPTDYALMTVSAYIHNNPRVAKMTTDPVTYQWSSYPYYCTPDLIAEPASHPLFQPDVITQNKLFTNQPHTSKWSTLTQSPISPRSPPEAFTREKIRQLFPTPLHHYYPRFVDREWTLHNLQKTKSYNKLEE